MLVLMSLRTLAKLLVFGPGTIAAVLLGGCERPPVDGRIHITYWEKWTGAEAAAMQASVDAFNQSQDRIFVEFLSVGGGIDRKVLLATAGGDPPDIAGV